MNDNRVPRLDGADPLSLRPIDRALMDLATERALQSPRYRALLRYHEFSDKVRVMINAFEPESYAAPHRHANPPKVEVFLVLRGSGVVVRFDDKGAVLEATTLQAGGPAHGVEIPPGAWHNVIALEPGSVFYEIKEGPYDPATDKEFAPWAPLENDPAAPTYLASLRATLGLPALADIAAMQMDAALDDDDLA